MEIPAQSTTLFYLGKKSWRKTCVQIKFCINLSICEMCYFCVILTLVKVQSQAETSHPWYFHCFKKLSYHWVKVARRNAATQIARAKISWSDVKHICSSQCEIIAENSELELHNSMDLTEKESCRCLNMLQASITTTKFFKSLCCEWVDCHVCLWFATTAFAIGSTDS